MANRRMFSKIIIDSDEFLDLPVSTRLLYYDLGMRADDDGFVQPKRVMRITGATSDDLNVLITRKFVINFDNKVLVITDWKINNNIRNDRYTETIFREYKKLLTLTDNNCYRLSDGIPDVIPTVSAGKVRLGKDRIGKINKDNTTDVVCDKSQLIKPETIIINYFKEIYQIKSELPNNNEQIKAARWLFKEKGIEKAKKAIVVAFNCRGQEFAPDINSVVDLYHKYGKLECFYARAFNEQDNKKNSVLEEV